MLFFSVFCSVDTHAHLSLPQTAHTVSKQEQASSAVSELSIIVVSLHVLLLSSWIYSCMFLSSFWTEFGAVGRRAVPQREAAGSLL